MLIIVILALRSLLVRLRARVPKGSPLAVIPLLIVSFGKAESQLASDAPLKSSNQNSAVGKPSLGGFRADLGSLPSPPPLTLGPEMGRERYPVNLRKAGNCGDLYQTRQEVTSRDDPN